MSDKETNAVAIALEKALKGGYRIILEPAQGTVAAEKPAAQAIEAPVPAMIPIPKTEAEIRAERDARESWIPVRKAAEMLGVAPSLLYLRISRNAIAAKKDECGHLLISSRILSGLPKLERLHTGNGCVPVYCKELQKTFGSIKEAAKEIGAPASSVSLAISAHKPVKGFNFFRAGTK